MANTKIEWTQSTWNPVTGCSKVSPGCAHCYAERMAKRLQAMGQLNYSNGFKITLHEKSLELPLQWKKPQTIFVNSMSDLFHEDVPLEFILRVFEVMNKAPWHCFQILTKRSQNLRIKSPLLPWAPNIWVGVSVETRDYYSRIRDLAKTGAVVKFLSCEPLLGPLPRLPLKGMDWVIVGGESGPHARPMDPAWVEGIRDQCLCSNVPFFFKQWGGTNKKRTGRILGGRTWDQKPRPLEPGFSEGKRAAL